MTQLDTDVDITALRQRVSRRDENARAAMQGIMSQPSVCCGNEDQLEEWAYGIAQEAYVIADAMERARNEGMSE